MDLQSKSRRIRYLTVDCIGHLGVGHIGGALSICDLLAVLYYDKMNIDPKNPQMPGRDRLICSKGHAGPAVYAVLADKGYFPIEMLHTLNHMDTKLPSHCDMNKTPGIDMTTGSLGQGFSCAMGVAKGAKLRGDGAYVYTIIGDGESQEGQIWEAAMFASHQKLDNIIAFTDMNGAQIDGTVEEVNSLSDIEGKWTSFGWDTQRIDGHNTDQIAQAIDNAKANPGKPHMIIMDTEKGKGVSLVQAAYPNNHNMNLTKEQTAIALSELA